MQKQKVNYSSSSFKNPVWEDMVFKLREWLKALQGQQEMEGLDLPESHNSTVAEYEWEAIAAVKKWRMGTADEILNLSLLNDMEKTGLEQLVLKSKVVSYNPDRESHKYSCVLFMPLALWNDDPTYDEGYKNWKDGNIFNSLPKNFQILYHRRLKDAWINIYEGKEEYQLACFPVMEESKVRLALSKGLLLDQPELLSKEIYEELIDNDKESWLKSGVMPVLVRGHTYESIMNLNFNSDGHFFEDFEEISHERWDFDEPMTLDLALEKLEELKWGLWVNDVLLDDMPDDTCVRESTLTVLMDGENILSLEVMINDIAPDGEILNTREGQRNIINADDLQDAIYPWIYAAHERMSWNMGYAQMPKDELKKYYEDSTNKTISSGKLDFKMDMFNKKESLLNATMAAPGATIH